MIRDVKIDDPIFEEGTYEQQDSSRRPLTSEDSQIIRIASAKNPKSQIFRQENVGYNFHEIN